VQATLKKTNQYCDYNSPVTHTEVDGEWPMCSQSSLSNTVVTLCLCRLLDEHEIRSLSEKRDFSLLRNTRTYPWAYSASCSNGYLVLFRRGVKRTGREAGCSTPSSDKFKNVWSSMLLFPLHTFIACIYLLHGAESFWRS
jgi:hypothetical protein